MRNRINEIRQKKGITIQKLSDLSGLTAQTVFRIIKGGTPTNKSIFKISKALEEKAENIFFI